MFRRSCGKCHFCNTKRPSDITLADFWGWEKTNTEINKDDKGISLILINTPKGKKLFDEVKQNMDVMPVRLEDCLQPNLQHPSAIHPQRNQFERDYINYGFEYIVKKYGDTGWRYNLKQTYHKVRSLIKLVIRR